MNVDIAVAMAIFLLFLTATIVFSINYFSKLPSVLQIPDLREQAIIFFKKFFESKGKPENWEESSAIPSVPGLIIDLRRIPITVKETAGISRVNEPIIINLMFDEDCENKTWNNTVRIYDENLTEYPSQLSDSIFCNSQFLKESNITFNVDISPNQIKKYWVYYSSTNTSSVNYTLTYDTDSWIPSNGDSWTESTSDWSPYGGTGNPTLDSINKKFGNYSINITGEFSNTLGLDYNPVNNITGVENGWYLHAWLFVDDLTGLSSVNLTISDNSETISTNVLQNLTSGSWYLFEKELSADWDGWVDFNASRGIDFIRFFAVNNTSGLTRTLKIDGLRFEKKPLEIKIYPEESVKGISPKKLDALRNLTYDELVEAIGKGYEFRMELSE